MNSGKEFFCPFLTYGPKGGPRLCPAETPPKEKLEWDCPLNVNGKCAIYVIATKSLKDIPEKREDLAEPGDAAIPGGPNTLE